MIFSSISADRPLFRLEMPAAYPTNVNAIKARRNLGGVAQVGASVARQQLAAVLEIGRDIPPLPGIPIVLHLAIAPVAAGVEIQS
jgi:hypothetical protein